MEDDTKIADILEKEGQFGLAVGERKLRVLADPSSYMQVKNNKTLYENRLLFDHHECKNIPIMEETVLKLYLDFFL